MNKNIWDNIEGKLKNLKIKDKMHKSFTTIMIGFGITIIAAVLAIIVIIVRNSAFYNKYYQNMKQQMELRMEVNDLEKSILLALSDNGSVNTGETDDLFLHTKEGIEKLSGNLDTRKTKEQLNDAASEMLSAAEELSALARAGKTEEAYKLYKDSYSEKSRNLSDVLKGIGTYADNASKKEYQTSIGLGIAIAVIMVLMGLFSSLLCVKLAKILSKSIKVPLNELKQATDSLREGRLDIEISYESADEIGKLADNFRKTCAQIREIIEDCGCTLEQMADGDFRVQFASEDKYVGDFERILVSIRKLNKQLNDTLLNINTASGQVAIGSGQMAEGAQELAEGATDQAGAVEELTANVEKVAKIAQESANAASAAAEMVRVSSREAGKSREEMKLLMNAMNQITETSHEIENIIGSIEDIASQTNLLSLNASIEAARAGEAGRGFAVVADQIGNLAADSARSAVNTRELIEKSLNEIENGNQITNRTMEMIGGVLSSMSDFEEAASGAASASITQADMLKQIEEGIEKISSVVQNNSASAEETSAVSQELSAEAETLRGMVAQFKLQEA